MSQQVLKQAKERYDIIADLLMNGTFPGILSPAVLESYNYAQHMSQRIQEQIDGIQDASSDRPKEDASGMGDSGVPSKRRRKNRK